MHGKESYEQKPVTVHRRNLPECLFANSFNSMKILLHVSSVRHLFWGSGKFLYSGQKCLDEELEFWLYINLSFVRPASFARGSVVYVE